MTNFIEEKMHDEKHKPIRCPVCNSRIIDANPNIRSEVRLNKEFCGSAPDYVQKCWKCGAQIGIKKVS